jgi:hypothetical protein
MASLFVSGFRSSPYRVSPVTERRIIMESWRRAWHGPDVPVTPFEDDEWVERRQDFINGLPSGPGLSDAEAAKAYRTVQAQWIVDHLEQLEDEDPALAARMQKWVDRKLDSQR